MKFIFLILSSLTISGPALHGYPAINPDTLPEIKIREVKLAVVPPSSGVQIFRDGIIYLSTTKTSRKMVADHVSFGKYVTNYTILNDTMPGKEELFSGAFGFPFPAEAVTFSPDYKTMYFTKFNEEDKVEKIFKAEMKVTGDGKSDWEVSSEPLRLCEGRFIYTHPSLSADGKLMIFASNRNGRGRMDLFLSVHNNNRWSDPENLGIFINSESDEMFPCFDKYGNIWFSSDRKPGKGGYDIYVAWRSSDRWEIPQNAGNGINTANDDVAFTIDRNEGKTAYYSVRKKNEPVILYKIEPGESGSQSLSELISGKQPVHYLAVKEVESTGNEVVKKSEPEQQTAPASNRTITNPTPVRKKESSPVNTNTVQPKPVTKASSAASRTDDVIYRVQIIGSVKAKGSYRINIEGKEYQSYEYLHAGAYRTCVGEFRTLKEAAALQAQCRKAGYPQAFVAAFRGNARTTDPSLFK